MSRYKIATKTDSLRYKIAKEVFGEVEDSDGVRDIPSWEIFEKCLEQHKIIAELEIQLENVKKYKFDIGQEVYYIDYMYAFDPDVRKYLAVKKGKIQDVKISEDDYVAYNFIWDEIRWIDGNNVFETKEQAEQHLKLLDKDKKDTI